RRVRRASACRSARIAQRGRADSSGTVRAQEPERRTALRAGGARARAALEGPHSGAQGKAGALAIARADRTAGAGVRERAPTRRWGRCGVRAVAPVTLWPAPAPAGQLALRRLRKLVLFGRAQFRDCAKILERGGVALDFARGGELLEQPAHDLARAG